MTATAEILIRATAQDLLARIDANPDADLANVPYSASAQQPSLECDFRRRWLGGTRDDVSTTLMQTTQFVMSHVGHGGLCASVARSQYAGPREMWRPLAIDHYLRAQRNLAEPSLYLGR